MIGPAGRTDCEEPMTYQEFWLRYLRAHRRPATRLMHYTGSVLAVGTLAVAAATLNWRGLIAAPLIGYTFAWTAHYAIERNRPETFGHPFWSLFSDFRMLLLALSFRLAPHLQSAGLR
jgi:hypothetical protein